VVVALQWHWVCEQGVRNLSWDEARRMSGEDPDFAK
jgi:catalase